MASRSLGTLTVDLIAKVGGFVAGMTQAERQADKSTKAMQKRLRELQNTAAGIGKAIGAGLLVAGTASAALVKAAIDNADAIDEMAQRTGIAVETLSRLQVAAKFGAVSMEDLQKSVGRLAVEQQKYAEGNEDTVELFDALGVKAVDASGKLRSAESVLIDLADVFQDLPDGAEKTALAIDLFGKAGQNLIPFLNQGGDRIAELNAEADRLGITLSAETAKAAGEFNDQLDLGIMAVQGLAATVAAELLPDLVRLVNSLTDLSKEGSGFVGVADDIADGLRAIWNMAKAAGIAIEGMGEQLDILGAARNLILDPANADKYKQEIEQSANRIAGLTDASRRLALETRQLLGIDPETPQSGGSSGSPNGRGRGVQVDVATEGEDRAEASRKLYEERRLAAEAAKGQAAADKAAAEAARELERADADLQRRLEEMAKQQMAFVEGLDQMEAQLSGPLAEAELDHATRMKEVQMLLDSGVITVEEATRAQMLYADAFARTKDRLDPYGESLRLLLEDMDFELDLLGKTNAERMVELELRRLGIEMGSKEADAAAARIRSRVEEYEATVKTISAMDDFRSSFEDNVASVLDGSKSIKDAVKDMLSDLVSQFARMAAQNWGEKLFGEMGSSDTGSAGGWLSSVFGSFFKREHGGPVMSGVPYLVGERGPELVIPSSAGTVIPAGKTAQMLGGRGDTNIIIQGSTSKRAIDRVQIQQGRHQARAIGEFA